MLNRRAFIATGAATGLAACARPQLEPVSRAAVIAPAPIYPPLPPHYGPVFGEQFFIPGIPEGALAPTYWRQDVPNRWPDAARGTIIIDPDAAFLWFVDTPATAMRYGVSVGAAGFDWEGIARLQFKREWPRWNVPEEMAARRPEFRPYTVANGGMDAGPGNPLGARALYLFQNDVDTLYRIHGDADPRELGRAVSSGCIRMLNQDAIHLYDRSVHGADVIVLPSLKPKELSGLY